MLLRVVSIILCKRLFRCLFHPSIRLLEYNDGLMDSGKSKKVNKSVISDNVFVILGCLDDHVSKIY